MIKNVIFDFGQVLIHFIPSKIVAEYVTDPDDAALLENLLFDRLYWDGLDDGSLDNDAMLNLVYPLLPSRLHEAARQIIYGWIYHIPEIEGMHELVRDLKARGDINLYLLSNISTYFASHASDYPVLSHFDGCVFSAVCKMIKPRAEIFAHLCERFDIRPEESIFIDDSPKNIAGAESFGIMGYLFDGDAKRLREYLDDLLNT
jgi:putative hydrolase of the HAD superfamily